MIMRAFLCVAAASALLLAGCGGGGGGFSKSGTLTYTTDWTHVGASGQISGLSQRVVVSGTSISTIVNQDATGTQTTSLGALADGDYHVVITLFSQRDAQGTTTGTIDTVVTVKGATALASTVGEAPTNVKVTPEAAAITIPSTAQFYAAGKASSGVLTFTTSDQFTWSTLGGVATVSSDGIVTATSAGTGTVRAQLTSAGTYGSAALTVSSSQVKTGKWTVMVFMNAANDLSQFDTYNMNQLETVAGNSDVRYVVQWKQAYGWWDSSPEFVGTRRYLVSQDSSSDIKSQLIQDLGTGVDMGSSTTLSDFISWAKTYYPAERYCLVIWNHGNGWHRGVERSNVTRGVSYDEDTGNHIDTWQLSQAVGGTHWSIISWDASLMQMMEVAYELKDVTDYVVGSEESPPGEGLPYDTIFAQFRDNPSASTADLTNAFVQGMVNDTAYTSRKITQSSIDTTKLSALKDALSGLANALIAHKSELGTAMANVRNSAKSYSLTASRWYYDIGSLCDQIDANVTSTDVNNATAAVRTALAAAVIHEGHNANSAGSTGLSIDFSPSTYYSSDDYPLLRFGQESTWGNWLSVAP